MPIVLLCPSCGVRLTLGDERAGVKLVCPKCDTLISVPGVPALAPSRPPLPPRVAPNGPPPLPPPIPHPIPQPPAFGMSAEDLMRAAGAVGIVAFALLAWLVVLTSPERLADFKLDSFGGRVYASLAVGTSVEVVALVCAVLFFGHNGRGTLAVGAAVGGALGALASQYYPLLADPITRYLAQPFSPVRLLGVGEHVVGSALLGCAVAYLWRRAALNGTAQRQPAQAQPEPGAAGPPNVVGDAALQRRTLLVLLSVAGAVVLAFLCVLLAGAIVGPRVVRTAAEWQSVRDGESVEIRGVAGFNHFEHPFFQIDVPVIEGGRVVFCNFDSEVWSTSNFREWRNTIGPGSPVVIRGIAHRTPAELKECRPVTSK